MPKGECNTSKSAYFLHVSKKTKDKDRDKDKAKDKDKDRITAHKATTTSDRRKQHNTRITNTQFDPLVPPTVCSFDLASCCLYRSLAASSRHLLSSKSCLHCV